MQGPFATSPVTGQPLVERAAVAAKSISHFPDAFPFLQDFFRNQGSTMKGGSDILMKAFHTLLLVRDELSQTQPLPNVACEQGMFVPQKKGRPWRDGP